MHKSLFVFNILLFGLIQNFKILILIFLTPILLNIIYIYLKKIHVKKHLRDKNRILISYKINFQMTCAIIIPSVRFDRLLKKCVKECLKQSYKKIKVYLVLDYLPDQKINNKKVIYLKCSGNISKKRNYGVKYSKEKYIAFIDSDAYPAKNWILNGVNYFLNKNFEGLLTGPDVAFPNEKGTEKIISYVNKSIFISGSKNYRKNPNTPSKFVKHASSCNMMIKKKIYLKIKGMDSDIYVGEDIAFCDKIKKKIKYFF